MSLSLKKLRKILRQFVNRGPRFYTIIGAQKWFGIFESDLA